MQVLKIVWVHCSMVRVNLMFKRDLGAILIWQPKERRYVVVINTDFVIEVLQTLSKNTTVTATATRTWQNKRSEQWPCTCVLKRFLAVLIASRNPILDTWSFRASRVNFHEIRDYQQIFDLTLQHQWMNYAQQHFRLFISYSFHQLWRNSSKMKKSKI